MPISLEQVTYRYSGADTARPALRDVTFTIPDGDFLGIIGHTGSGKSTLVQLIAGLLQPTLGRVTLDGIDLADRSSRRALRRSVGIAFQYPEHQLFADTVADDVAFGPRALGVPPREIEQRVTDALERVDIDICTFGHRSPFELSGGQMRRVAIAGVLATRPSILILDEPMAGLDPAGRAEIAGLLERLHAQGLTVVMISHDMDDIAKLAERILVLRSGSVFALGTPEEIFSRPSDLREIGLGVPHSVRFTARLAACGILAAPAFLTPDMLAASIADSLGHHCPGEVD